MLGEKHFRLMKKTAIFINTGRGPTVQEAALIKALEEKWIAYAGLDVLEMEPPGNNNPLLWMDNVILSAHTALRIGALRRARKRHVGRELALVLEGRWPMSCVNPAVLQNTTLRRWQPVAWSAAPTARKLEPAATPEQKTGEILCGDHLPPCAGRLRVLARKSEHQRLGLLDLRQRLHLGEHVGRHRAVDLDQRDGVAARLVAAEMEGRDVDAWRRRAGRRSGR